MSSDTAYKTPMLTHHITPDEAHAAATEFLLDHLGNQLVAGEPLLMVSAVRAVWIVPVHLAYIHIGMLGSVGVVAVDEETSQVVAWTPILQMKAASHRLREAFGTDLADRFQSFMAPPSQAESQ